MLRVRLRRVIRNEADYGCARSDDGDAAARGLKAIRSSLTIWLTANVVAMRPFSWGEVSVRRAGGPMGGNRDPSRPPVPIPPHTA